MATFPLVCANCRAAIHPALAAPRTDGACPECGAPTADLRHGREFAIREVDVET